MVDRPQPPLTRATAPTAFALRNIADRKARGRHRAAATVEAFGNEVAWTDADGWRYQLEAPPRVTIAAKDTNRAAATVDLKVWDATGTLIFRDRIHAWDGFPVLVPDGTQHEEDDGLGGKVRVSNFRESPLEAARADLAHTVRVVTKNGPWVKDKPGTVSTFYGTELDNYRVESNSTVYATALSGAGLSTSSFQTQAFGQRLDGATYSLHQCFEEFDTSTIGSDTISDAVLSIYINGDLSDTDFTAQARTYDHGGSISTADWRTAAQLGALTLLATLASSGVTTSAYNSFTASGTNLIDGINTGGATRLLYTSDRQVSQTAPTGQERLQYATAVTAGTTQDPKLVVTHAPAFPGDIDHQHAHLLLRHTALRIQEVAERIASAIRQAELLPFSTLVTDRELQWHLGGRVEHSRELRWLMGGTVSTARALQWRVAPSPLRVHYALTGRSGPVSYAFRFERRTIANQFLQDVTPAFLGGSIEANNDRDVFRTATFTVDANAVDDRGNAVTIDPLADHIAVFMDLLVDGSYTLGLPMGLFALNVPRKRYEPGSETWEIAASDNGIHLMEATTTASYTVAAGQNYITGTNAVRDILDALGLVHALPNTSLTLPVSRTWPAGTPWLRIVNDLLHAAGMYSLWFDATGIARTRAYDDLSTRTPDVTYTGDDFVLIPITEEAETTRLANQVVAVVDDPSRAVLTSVKTNADPDSPISTVTLGRTITKVIQSDAADQTTLDAIAENYLRNEAGLYRRGTLLTSIDPRREAREVYELTVDGVYVAERWWARNWRVQLDIGAQQQHTLGKVERVAAS